MNDDDGAFFIALGFGFVIGMILMAVICANTLDDSKVINPNGCTRSMHDNQMIIVCDTKIR